MELGKKSPFIRGVDWQHDQTDVFIGIDFGTSYSKVSYTVRGSKKGKSIFFNNKDEYYLPSVIYWDGQSKKLLFNSSGEDIPYRKLKFFKYTMIDSTLKHHNQFVENKTETDKERLYSAFYLGCLINIVRNIIRQEIHNKQINWYFNMGTPLRDPNLEAEKNNIYKEILNVGYEFSKEMNECKEIILDDFDNFYKGKKEIINNNLHTYPELFAEINLYHKDPNTPEGFYSIIDVGGGTVDMALFFKRYVNGRNEANCVSKDVVPYGFELLIEKVLNNKFDKDDFNNYPIQGLKGKTIIKFSDDISVDVSRFYDEFKAKYGQYFNFAEKYFDEEFKKNSFVKYFIFGGGKEIKLYHLAMEEINKAKIKERIFIKKSDYQIENDRLVISQMLAQPFADLIPIDNIMSDAAAKMIEKEKKNEPIEQEQKDSQEKMDEILRERYGGPL